MRTKIFASVFWVALAAIFITATLSSFWVYRQYLETFEQSVRDEAHLIWASAENSGEDFTLHLQKTKDSFTCRITLISAEGPVLFDSRMDLLMLENHANRPEVIEAEEKGISERRRFSTTFKQDAFFYALRLGGERGPILRAGKPYESFGHVFLGMLPTLSLIVLASLGAALLMAKLVTNAFIKPVNAIDLTNPDADSVYDELSPLIGKIRQQNAEIDAHIASLKSKQTEFAAITDNMSEGFVLLGKADEILSYNHAATQILALPDKDCRNSSILLYNRSSILREALTRSAAGQSSETVIEKNGRAYLLIANPVEGDDSPRGTMLLLMDVTEKEERERLRREFSANVSHELKTPLTTIRGYSELIKNNMVSPSDVPGFAGTIHEEAGRLIALIEDIIKISRLDENNSEPEREAVNLLSLAETVASRLTEPAALKNITLDVSGEPHSVKGIRRELEALLYNLCVNAVNYGRENGHVWVTVSSRAGNVLLSVRDDGIGIPKEDIPHIFERFYRVDKSRSKDTGGTGLGLSIVKHAAALHSAKLSLTSEPGKGTTVEVLFPRPDVSQ